MRKQGGLLIVLFAGARDARRKTVEGHVRSSPQNTSPIDEEPVEFLSTMILGTPDDRPRGGEGREKELMLGELNRSIKQR